MNITDRVLNEANRLFGKPRKSKEDMIIIIASILFMHDYGPENQKEKVREYLAKFIPADKIDEVLKEKEIWKTNAVELIEQRSRKR